MALLIFGSIKTDLSKRTRTFTERFHHVKKINKKNTHLLNELQVQKVWAGETVAVDRI